MMGMARQRPVLSLAARKAMEWAQRAEDHFERESFDSAAAAAAVSSAYAGIARNILIERGNAHG